MTGFLAASRSSLLEIAILFLVGFHGFRSKISHFATKAIFEMGSSPKILIRFSTDGVSELLRLSRSFVYNEVEKVSFYSCVTNTYYGESRRRSPEF